MDKRHNDNVHKKYYKNMSLSRLKEDDIIDIPSYLLESFKEKGYKITSNSSGYKLSNDFGYFEKSFCLHDLEYKFKSEKKYSTIEAEMYRCSPDKDYMNFNVQINLSDGSKMQFYSTAPKAGKILGKLFINHGDVHMKYIRGKYEIVDKIVKRNASENLKENLFFNYINDYVVAKKIDEKEIDSKGLTRTLKK